MELATGAKGKRHKCPDRSALPFGKQLARLQLDCLSPSHLLYVTSSERRPDRPPRRQKAATARSPHPRLGSKCAACTFETNLNSGLRDYL
eukprot:15217065-Alexandrium_andersonii.AAC.1